MSNPSASGSTTSGFRPESLTDNLNAAQYEAVTTPASPLRVLAGAGSGKTRVLTHRIAYRAHVGTLDPSRVLAVTFTRKAATELRSRLGGLGLREGVTSGTFHSIAYAQLRQRWEERGIRPPELLDRKVGFVSRLMSTKTRSSVIDVVGEIEWASARMITPETYEHHASRSGRTPPLNPAAIASIYERFIKEKQRRRLVDFDDILKLAVRDLEADPVYAAGRHWRFRHLFIDEFQDVNPLQHRLVTAWLGAESDFCAVGDPNQAIYAWNGADATYMNDFDSFFPSSTTVILDQNYRSTPQILTVANSILSEGGARSAFRLKATRREGPLPKVIAHEDATDEARSIARAIRDRHVAGRGWSQQAVLVRTNAQGSTLVEEFKRAGIPHAIRGAGQLLSQPEVKDALTLVRRSTSLDAALADIEATVRTSAPSFYASQTRGVGPGTSHSDASGAGDIDAESQGTLAPDLDRSSSPALSSDALSVDRASNLMELVRLGAEYKVLDPTGGIAGFTSWLVSTLQGDDTSTGNVVEIMSFHAAKGLEWPIVHLAGLEEGYVPIHHAKKLPAAMEEERRLLYVAMTRAKDELLCNWAENREFGTRKVKRKPSPWVDTILETTGVAAQDVSAVDGASRAKAARRRAAGSTSSQQRERRERHKGGDSSRRRSMARDSATKADLTDEQQALFEQLRRWRKVQADGADVPAFVVFSDETLVDLTIRLPKTRQEILDVRGIGPVKAQRYADDLLGIIADSH